MANKPTPTSRHSECPICADVSGKCRFIDSSDGEFILCWTNSGARLLEIINGHRCVKEALAENWATFVVVGEANLEDLARKRQERELAKAREREELAKEALPIEDRDRAIRSLHRHFGLSVRHREGLRKRGLTDYQIDNRLYFTINPNQEVPFGIPANLPGVSYGQIKAAGTGYACVAFDTEGRATGWQVRLDDVTDNRYRWAKGRRSSHLASGELPITSAYPIGDIRRHAIGVCEGVSKPGIAANRLGQVFIGASSANFASSPEQTKEHLLAASQRLGTKQIEFAADAGAVSNPHVVKAYRRSWELFAKLGYEVRVSWWGQVQKDAPDIDELQPEQIDQILLLTIAEFEAICRERGSLPKEGFARGVRRQIERGLQNIEIVNPEDFKLWGEREEIGKSASKEISPKILPQPKSTQNQQTSRDKSQKPGQSLSNKINQESPLLPQSTILDILNPPLIASFPTQSLRNGISRVLPIPESVASCLTTEKKAPRKERRWFESVLKRIKKVFSKNANKGKTPRLGFKCFKEDNPEFEEKIRQVQRKLRSLSYEPDILLNQRYLPDDLPTQLPKSGLIGLVAPKGSGKSYLLKKIIQLAKKQGITILSITPRIALGREQAIKWEITWIDDYGVMQTRAEDTTRQIAEVAQKRSEARDKLAELEKISHYQLSLSGEGEPEKIEQQKDELRTEIERYGEQIENINTSSIKTLALCWDSLWRTKDRDLKESLILIDEAELGFKHFISGSTCKRNRPYLLKVFKDKLVECLMTGGRVILSDADLTDLPINYVRQILPIPINPFIVKNEYIGEETRWVVDLRTGNRGNTLDDIFESIRDGAYLAITTDSQAEAQALEKRILQELPDDFCAFLDVNGEITQDAQARQKALIVRVDRTTTEAELGKKFIQKPNEQILHWKPRLLIYTPSMGVGVSIDETTQRWDEEWQEMVPYFDAVYGLLFGVIEPSQCRQQLARVRANVPRIVYCKESNKALEGCSSFFPEEVKRQTLKYNHSALNILDIAKGIAGYEADDEEIRSVMLQLLTDAWDKDSRCWREPSIDLASAFKARENYGLWNLASLLREELEDEGHTVVSLEGVKTDLVGQMAAIKDELKTEEATLIAKAPTMPVEEARKILNKLGATKDEHRSAQKTLLQEELPEVNLTPEFVKKAVVDDRRRWLNQHRLFWYHSNPEAVKQIDTDHWLSNLRKFAEGTPFMRDIRSNAPKVDALRKSGVFEFIDLENCDRIYQGDTPEAQAFLKQCLKYKDQLQTALNVLVTNKSTPISLANRILNKVGLKLEKLTRSNKDNRWQLSIDLVNDLDRANVLKAFDLRWKLTQEEAEQKLAKKHAQAQYPQDIQLGGQSLGYIDTKTDRPPSFEVTSQGVSEEFQAVALGVSPELQKSPQTQSQQVTQLGGQSPGYIDTKTDRPPSFEVASQGGEDSVEQLKQAFEFCELPHQFAWVTEGYSIEIIEKAIALQDSQPRRRELAEWHQQLSQGLVSSGEKLAHEPEVLAIHPSLDSYQPGQAVWGYFPQAEVKWLRATVESVGNRLVRIATEFHGILVEKPELIAPGHWLMSG